MMKKYTHSALAVMMLLAACLIFGLAGSAMAVHPPIPLLDAGGNAISATAVPAPAFSVKETCGACHGNAAYPDLLGYDAIEKHSYHAQLGANQLAEWNSANAKPWGQQSPGHFGKW